MRQISTDDFLLANEAQLIYEKASGFEPVRGNLKHWKGFVGIIEGTEIPIFANIWIQDGFPDIPPFVDITPKVNHPNVEDDGTLSLRILSNWKNNYNIYEVMNDIMDLFTKVPAKTYKTKVKRAKKEERTSGLPIYSIQTRQLPQTQARTIKVDPKIEEEKRSTEESIVSYQRQIETVSRNIEKEREALLKEGGVKIETKEVSISREDDLKADISAVADTLETIHEKFEDGDMTNVDFLKLYRRYSKKGYKAEKQLNKIRVDSSGSMTKEEEKILELEADLFASIVTLDNLIQGYEDNEIEQIAYRKQLRSLLRGIFKSRMQLEKVGFNLDEFVKREKMEERYSKGIRQLRVAEGVETADAISIPFDTLKKMPSKTADFVSSAIELIDLTRLRSVARADLLLADIDEMLHILKTFPSIPEDHWVISDLNNWRDILSKYKPQDVIKEEDCEKLEFQAARWLNDFRRLLKEL
ncbi:MAG: ubiquitin-conjugating enzyme E2 variant [Candidatus Heimdallarchaeaceae archaeon]